MNEYEAFRVRAKQFRDDLVAAATKEADAWLSQTLGMLARLPAGPDGSADNQAPRPVRVGTTSTGRIRLSDLILRVVPTLRSRFSTNDVLGAINGQYAIDTPSRKSNVSTALKKLAQRGDVFVLERKGRGSRPSTYKRTGGEP